MSNLPVGKITKLYGTEGEVVANLYDRFPADYDSEEPLFVSIDSLTVPLFIESFTRRGNSGAIVRFADIDNDLLPDIAISRLSASDVEEAKIMVDKQIDYEFLNPVTDEKFYDSPIMTCAFQMEKWFQISTESVNGYLSSIGKEPYRYTMHYYYESNYNKLSNVCFITYI